MDEFFGKRLKAAPRRYDLCQDFRAIPVGFQHSLHAVKLADDLADSQAQRCRLTLGMSMGMVVSVRFGHRQRFVNWPD